MQNMILFPAHTETIKMERCGKSSSRDEASSAFAIVFDVVDEKLKRYRGDKVLGASLFAAKKPGRRNFRNRHSGGAILDPLDSSSCLYTTWAP